jgi:hypothetical protein
MEGSGNGNGSPGWTRTNDQRINSPTLYRLSYRGVDVLSEGREFSLLTGSSVKDLRRKRSLGLVCTDSSARV